MKEIWKEFLDGYEVSNLGRVRSYWNCGKKEKLKLPRKILTPYKMPKGYLVVSVNKKTILVHRIVLKAFIGPPPAGMESAHLNGNKADNRLCNLQWKTSFENYKDKIKHGTNGHKLSHVEVRKIRDLLSNGFSLTQLAKSFQVTKQTIFHIRSGKIWKHLQ